jgi:hypothetical protein
MATIPWDKPRQIQGVATRLTRLDATGAPIITTGNVLVTQGLVEFTWTPTYRDGDEKTIVGAAGDTCFEDKAADVLRRIDATLRFCYVDPARDAFLAGGTVITETVGADTETTGYNAPRVGVDPNANGVAVEVWAKAKDAAGSLKASRPYLRYFLPKSFWKHGAGNINTDPFVPNYAGYGIENAEFGEGPDDADPITGATTSAIGYRRVATYPTES